MSQSTWRLISSVVPDVGALPLHLPVPDGINNGGYPGLDGYSPIDLLVAGLEADRLGCKVLNLTYFFDNNQHMVSDQWVKLSAKQGDTLYSFTVLEWKNVIVANKDHHDLKAMFLKNAPLTFKWI